MNTSNWDTIHCLQKKTSCFKLPNKSVKNHYFKKMFRHIATSGNLTTNVWFLTFGNCEGTPNSRTAESPLATSGLRVSTIRFAPYRNCSGIDGISSTASSMSLSKHRTNLLCGTIWQSTFKQDACIPVNGYVITWMANAHNLPIYSFL